ncbi:hypothetical protein ACIQXV_26600 [Neobacillus sp. NPDC097160]|uniref:hypothetical protein n=1 Tax=Neobacillus sp. NPDC097160 TaxID=3364298 RepID=UPI0037F5AE8F
MLSMNPIGSDKKAFFILVICFIIFASSILTFSFPVFIMQVLMMSITLPLITRKDYRMVKLYLFIFAYSLAFVFLIYIANNLSYGSPYYFGGSDDINFENEGKIINNSGMLNPKEILESGIIGFWHNAPFFSLYISALIKFSDWFGGYNTFLPRIMNVYYLVWICLIFEYFLKKYTQFTDKKVFYSILFFTLTPNIQYINAHVFRDTFNLLQILLIVLLFEKLLSNQKYFRKILTLVTLPLLIYITYYTRINSLVFAGALCGLILAKKLRINNILFLIAIIPILFMSNFFAAIRFDYFIKSYSSYTLELAGNGLSRYVFEQPLIPFGLIFRVFYALITPFPNFFGLFKDEKMILLDFSMLLVFIGVIFQILSVPFILKRLLKFDWLSLSFLILFFSIISTTFTFRHVLIYYPLMVAVGVDGYLSLSKNRRVKYLYLSGTVGLFFALIYMILKVF